MNKVEVKLPSPGESVQEVQIAKWHYSSGDFVDEGALILEIESDKASLEVYAEESGVIDIHADEGEILAPDTTVAIITKSKEKKKKSDSEKKQVKQESCQQIPVKAAENSSKESIETQPDIPQSLESRAITEKPHSQLRKKLAHRLKDVQKQAAILSTFNEVNLDPLFEFRASFPEEKQPSIVSIFAKAAANALIQFPSVNSEWTDNALLLKHFVDISIAVSTEKGLVVPVIKDCHKLNISEIDNSLKELATQARDGKLTISQMQGGTFTISNGGVFGSMLSTPILNPPQTAILGMHSIQKRPVVINDQIVIRPMMYLALSYDHRVLDGKEAVQFLCEIKSQIESPAKLVL